MEMLTKRLIISLYKASHMEVLLNDIKNEHGRDLPPEEIKAMDDILAQMKRYEANHPNYLNYEVRLKVNDISIGKIHVDPHSAELYCLVWNFEDEYRGKGFATEAVTAMLAYVFDQGALRVAALVGVNDISSQELCEGLGMHAEDEPDDFELIGLGVEGTPQANDCCVFVMTRYAWLSLHD